MREGRQSENIISSLVDPAGNVSTRNKSVSFFGEESLHSMSNQFSCLFGRQKPVHHLLGGGRSADVLLWRNKKISASVLSGATVVWILFEWLNYHCLSFVCLSLALGMLTQFLWSNVSGLLNKSPSHVPRLVLPYEMFLNIGMTIGAETNRALDFIQDVACGGTLKQFLSVYFYHSVIISSTLFATSVFTLSKSYLCCCQVIGILMAAAIIGSWGSFLTVVYVGFIAAHTLPVLYEKYDDKIDNFIHKLLSHLQKNYKKLDANYLRRIPTGRFGGRKHD